MGIVREDAAELSRDFGQRDSSLPPPLGTVNEVMVIAPALRAGLDMTSSSYAPCVLFKLGICATY